MSEPGTLEQAKTIEIPTGLTDFREPIPPGYVSVYRMVQRESLEDVASNGLRVSDNRMKELAPEVETIFDEEAAKQGIHISRGKCNFAFPRPHPGGRSSSFSYYPNTETMLEIKISPVGAVVTNAEDYTEAERALAFNDGEKIARPYAKRYWEKAIPLVSYLQAHRGEEADDSDFSLPEVLIPADVRPGLIRIYSGKITEYGDENE